MANGSNNHEEMNAIQRDRMERRRNTRRKSMITTTVFVVAIVAVLGGLIFGAVKLLSKNNDNNNNQVAPTVSATIAPAAATTPSAPQSTTPAVLPTQSSGSTTPTQPSQYAPDPAFQPGGSGSQIDEPVGSDEPEEGSSSSAPEPVSDGKAMHFYANGETSGGYNWTYADYSGLVDVKCKYDFDTKTYDFTITGLSEGTANVTLYYYTSDDIRVPVDLVLNIDSDLNVTQIG